MANFQLILDCFIANFKLKYEDSKHLKTDRVRKYSHFQLTSDQTLGVFYGTPGIFQKTSVCRIGELRKTWNLFNPYPLITVLDRN